MSRILVVGHACLDMVTRVERRPHGDEKVEAVDAWVGGGGPGANAAVALRRLGHEVRLATSIGDDEAGRIVADELRGEGVELIVDPGGGSTALAQIQVVGGERAVVWLSGTAPAVGDVADAVDDVDLLYLDGHQIPAATGALARAGQRDVPVIADLGTLREGVDPWLTHLVWAIASPRFAAALAGGDESIEAGLAVLRARSRRSIGVGITLGGRGGVAEVDGERVTWGPRKVRVLDTTGAGDAFHAGLADAFLHDLSPVDTLQWASAVGASVCRELGGRRMLPPNRSRMAQFEAAWPELPLDDRRQGTATM